MATISFGTTFNLTLSPKQFIFNDSSDYAGQGISVNDVNGCFKITSPSGIVIYNNTDFSDANCDILIDTALTNQTVISLPLGTNGLPELGTYTILYTVYNSNALTYYTVTNTYTNGYARPEVEIEQTVGCISPLFTSEDITDYVVNGTAPVIVRTHTIDYPYGSAGEGSPTIGTGTIVTTSTFYQGTQTTEIESDLTYTFPDNLIVIDTITGTQEDLVDCKDTCTIYCCIRSLEQRMIGYATTNTKLYAETSALFAQIMGLVGMVQLSIRCGKSDDVAGYITSLKQLANCTDDCSCSGDEPTQVVGIGGLVNEVIVDSGGSPVIVTPVTVGNTTTYTVTLDPSFVNNVNTTWTRVFANSAARASAIPDFNGQLGTQIDTDTVYEAIGVNAGDWLQINFFKPGAGTNALMTKTATSAAGNNSNAIGVSATASGVDSISIGTSTASADNTVSIGKNATASFDEAVSIGTGAGATNIGATAVGNGTLASASESTTVGNTSITSGTKASSFGYSVIVSGTESFGAGSGVNISGNTSYSIGKSTSVSGNNSVGIGKNASVSTNDSIGIGLNVSVSGDSSVSVGKGSSASAANSISYGKSAAASGANSISIGISSVSSNSSSLSIGNSALATGGNSISIGHSAVSTNASSISLGTGTASADFTVSIGSGATASGDDGVAIGRDPIASEIDSVAIGTSASATGQDGTAIGRSASASGDSTNAMGNNAIASAFNGNAIGREANAAAESTNALGYKAVANIEKTTQINGTIITKKDSSEVDQQLEFSGSLVTITGPEVDLKVIGDSTNLVIPTGSMFYPDEVDLILTTVNNVTGQPTIQAGGDVSTASLLAPIATTALTLQFHRQRFSTLLTSTGQATLTAGITVAATGTTVKGRFVFRGILVENQ